MDLDLLHDTADAIENQTLNATLSVPWESDPEKGALNFVVKSF